MAARNTEFTRSPDFKRAALDNLPRIFPDMGFVLRRGVWQSPFKLSGGEASDKRRDKTIISVEYAMRNSLRLLEHGGESVPLLDFYMGRNNCDFPEAVRRIAGIVGMQPPEDWDAEEEKGGHDRQNRLEAIVEEARKNLQATEAGKAVSRVLREERGGGGQGRGYTQGFVDWSEAGYFTRGLAERLKAECIINESNKWNARIGGSETLAAFPFRSNGIIRGFVFRSFTAAVTGSKYIDVFLSEADSKKYHLFGLRGLKLSGDGEQRRDIVIVEGELDALISSYSGVRNVCASTGNGNIHPEALARAKSFGVRRVTILFDTDATEEGRRNTAKSIEKAVEAVALEGLSPYVCELPAPAGRKEDPDSFLTAPRRDETEPEDPEERLKGRGRELQGLIDRAEDGYLWRWRRICAETGTDTDKNKEILRERTIALCVDTAAPERSRVLVLNAHDEATGGFISDEEIRRAEGEREERKRKREQEARAKGLVEEAQRLMGEGKTEEALSLLQSQAPEIRGISDKTLYEREGRLQTEEEIRQAEKRKIPGLPTQYIFGLGKRGKRLRLPAGALTFIGAQTSHGKSRVLENLAYWQATHTADMREVGPGAQWDGGRVLYLSFEEDREAVQHELFNIHLNRRVAEDNLEAINDYFSSGVDSFDFESDFGLEDLNREKREFNSLITSGRLQVLYYPFDSSQIIGFVNHLREGCKVKAVFIDYVQRLRKKGTKGMKKEELQEICDDLMQFSVEAGIPVVLAAQLNRQALSPVDMDVQNISDACEIEQSANIVMLLWNSAVRPLKDNSYFYKPKAKDKQGKEELTEKGSRIENRGGFHIGEEGHIYAVLAKNRGGRRGIDAVLPFEGNTGVITAEAGLFDAKEERLKGGQTAKKRREAPIFGGEYSEDAEL